MEQIISLGSNCSITYQLNKYNLRNTAYPFDWSEIRMNKLVEIFTNTATGSLMHLTKTNPTTIS